MYLIQYLPYAITLIFILLPAVLLGFDGIRKYGIDESSLFVSSMCQPIEELARLCVETLLKKRQGTVVPTLSLLPVTYCYGGTTRRES